MRINKFLANSGLDSRRKCEEFVLNGRIKVNGIVIKDLSTNILDSDIVLLDDKVVNKDNGNSNYYLMLNKPKCYITSVSDNLGRCVVLDLIKDKKYGRIFPVGRLDYNTEGLLILTNDGDFANKIIHPSAHINKTYELTLKYKPTLKQLKDIRNGILIDGVKTLPAIVSNVEMVNQEKFMLLIKIFEGKNREIRKICDNVGLKLLNLKRIAIGSLTLGDLKKGEYRELTENELNTIFC